MRTTDQNTSSSNDLSTSEKLARLNDHFVVTLRSRREGERGPMWRLTLRSRREAGGLLVFTHEWTGDWLDILVAAAHAGSPAGRY